MKFPVMEKPWDSRFTEIVSQRQYEAFRKDYMAKVRPHLEAKLTRLQDSKKRKTSAVSNNQRLYAVANANVLENGATEVRFKLVRTVLAKLAKSEVKKNGSQKSFGISSIGNGRQAGREKRFGNYGMDSKP